MNTVGETEEAFPLVRKDPCRDVATSRTGSFQDDVYVYVR